MKKKAKTKRHKKEKTKAPVSTMHCTVCCPGERGCGRQELHVQHQVHQHQHQRRQQQRTGNHHFNHDVRIHKTVPQNFELKVSFSLSGSWKCGGVGYHRERSHVSDFSSGPCHSLYNAISVEVLLKYNDTKQYKICHTIRSKLKYLKRQWQYDTK